MKTTVIVNLIVTVLRTQCKQISRDCFCTNKSGRGTRTNYTYLRPSQDTQIVLINRYYLFDIPETLRIRTSSHFTNSRA